MDSTPGSCQNSSQSGCFSGSRSLFESTPNADSSSTPLFPFSRKRKASFLENCSARKLADVIEACPPSPPFSSTFNDSLMNHLEKFHIEAEESVKEVQKGIAIGQGSAERPRHNRKIFKSNEHNKKIRSAPNTPEKPPRSVWDSAKRANTSSFVKNFSQISVQSPLNKEAYGILYPELPPLEPCRKPLTPQKFKENFEKGATQAKKCLFTSSRRDLFGKVFSNTIIVANIFRHLSDGDLYRLSMVSPSLKDSLRLDFTAYDRYRRFVSAHRGSKENYRITPPKSPGKEDGAPTDVSPGSKNFYYFCDIASELNKNQSLVKCPRCGKPSVVENSIAQCQDVNRCGYIFCKKCNSFAIDPKDFRDKCNSAQIVNVRPRSRLGDLSNSTVTSDYMTDSNGSSFFSSSLNLSQSNRYDSSGFFSECEGATPLMRARRNLSKSFTSAENKPRALASKNNNNKTSTAPHKLQRRSSVLPVVALDVPKPVEIVEPSSPPKVKSYSICSKQSKRNLKRLTR